MNQNPPQSPLHIGWRTIKTAAAATLVAMVYCAVGRNPAFACIGVIFGIGSDMKDSIKNGGNRLFGTLIGGLLSIAVFRLYLIFFPHGGHTVWLALFLGLGIVALIQLCPEPHFRHRRRRHCGTAHQLPSPPGAGHRPV